MRRGGDVATRQRDVGARRVVARASRTRRGATRVRQSRPRVGIARHKPWAGLAIRRTVISCARGERHSGAARQRLCVACAADARTRRRGVRPAARRRPLLTLAHQVLGLGRRAAPARAKRRRGGARLLVIGQDQRRVRAGQLGGRHGDYPRSSPRMRSLACRREKRGRGNAARACEQRSGCAWRHGARAPACGATPRRRNAPARQGLSGVPDRGDVSHDVARGRDLLGFGATWLATADRPNKVARSPLRDPLSRVRRWRRVLHRNHRLRPRAACLLAAPQRQAAPSGGAAQLLTTTHPLGGVLTVVRSH